MLLTPDIRVLNTWIIIVTLLILTLCIFGVYSLLSKRKAKEVEKWEVILGVRFLTLLGLITLFGGFVLANAGGFGPH